MSNGMIDAERTQKLEDSLYAMLELFDTEGDTYVLIGEDDDVTDAIVGAYDALNSATDEDGGF